MALKFSKLAIIVVLAVLIPATFILVLVSNIGPTGAFLVLILWVVIPVAVAKFYYWAQTFLSQRE
jgi:hypothetical protein